MKTRLYPMVQFKKDTWEIDEFECASVFVLVGKEKAMVIDAGIGIGDLIGAIRMTITDKPLVIVATHGHGDHTGGMGNFDEYYLSEKDWFYPVEESIEMRRGYSAMIAKRQGGYYPWVADRDITPFEKQPRRLPLEAGVEFDLGGRIIKTIACPGHTLGQIAFLDESSRSLFCGDALNCNLGYGGMPGKPIDWEHVTSVERALEGLEVLAAAKNSYDGILQRPPRLPPARRAAGRKRAARCDDALQADDLRPVQRGADQESSGRRPARLRQEGPDRDFLQPRNDPGISDEALIFAKICKISCLGARSGVRTESVPVRRSIFAK